MEQVNLTTRSTSQRRRCAPPCARGGVLGFAVAMPRVLYAALFLVDSFVFPEGCSAVLLELLKHIRAAA
jgi:hypothetical protein